MKKRRPVANPVKPAKTTQGYTEDGELVTLVISTWDAAKRNCNVRIAQEAKKLLDVHTDPAHFVWLLLDAVFQVNVFQVNGKHGFLFLFRHLFCLNRSAKTSSSPPETCGCPTTHLTTSKWWKQNAGQNSPTATVCRENGTSRKR